MVGVPEIALLLLLAVASATDLLWGKIYNSITFPFLVSGLLYHFVEGGWNALGTSLFAVGVAFALFFPLFAVKAVAAGDGKLLMAMGAWMEPKAIIQIAGISILIGAAVGLLAILREKGFRGSAKSIVENIKSVEPTARATRMPFGPAFFCAYLVVSVAQYRHWELL